MCETDPDLDRETMNDTFNAGIVVGIGLLSLVELVAWGLYVLLR
jgi:hypothetical protein